jgi:hypothetical protein
MTAENWICWQHGMKLGAKASRSAAQGLVERPFRSGNAMVRNIHTGEEWERRAGSWFKTRDHWPAKGEAS